MDTICNSIEINRVAAELGGKPELINWAYANGSSEIIRMWELPNGFRAIETNGDPVFETADQDAFDQLSDQFGE